MDVLLVCAIVHIIIMNCVTRYWVCFSRQRYVLGDSAMRSLAQSNVLIYNLGGLGIEIGNYSFSSIFQTYRTCHDN